jgi:hypothetical protein
MPEQPKVSQPDKATVKSCSFAGIAREVKKNVA